MANCQSDSIFSTDWNQQFAKLSAESNSNGNTNVANFGGRPPAFQNLSTGAATKVAVPIGAEQTISWASQHGILPFLSAAAATVEQKTAPKVTATTPFVLQSERKYAPKNGGSSLSAKRKAAAHKMTTTGIAACSIQSQHINVMHCQKNFLNRFFTKTIC